MANSDCEQQEAAQVSTREIEQRLRSGFQQTDAVRRSELEGMTLIKRAKLVSSRRERGRLEAKHGAGHPLVARADKSMQSEHRLLVQARMESARLAASPPERKDTGWTVHGYVRDIDGHPVEGAKVGLYTDAAANGEPVQTAATDANGYFRLTLESESPPGGKEEATAGGRKPNLKAMAAARQRPLYLAADERRTRQRQVACQPLYAIPGGLAYRDLRLPAVTRESAFNLPTRLIGDSAGHGLHDLSNEKPACRISEIPPGRRVFFRSLELARQAGYESCPHCFGRARSKR